MVHNITVPQPCDNIILNLIIMDHFEKNLIAAIHKELETIYHYHRHNHNSTLPIVLFVDDIIKVYHNDNRAAIYLQDDRLRIDYYFPKLAHQRDGNGHHTHEIDLNDPNFDLTEIANTINTNLHTWTPYQYPTNSPPSSSSTSAASPP